MNMPRAPLHIALLALLSHAAPTQAAAPGEPSQARALGSASLEAAPAAWGDGRWRMRARLHAAPPASIAAKGGVLKLKAALVARAAAATCPAPGTLFADGFESP